MPWRKPQFKLAHLTVLIALLAVELGLLPGPLAVMVAGSTTILALFASVVGPLKAIEWAIMVMILLILIAILLPSPRGSHGRGSRPRPSATTAPSSGKI